MGRRSIFAATLVVGLGVIASSPSAQPLPVPPSPDAATPARSDAEVREWARNYVQVDGWAIVGNSTGSVTLMPKTFVKSASGHVRTAMRVERIEDLVQNGFTTRSSVQNVDFDCGAAKMKIEISRTFTAQNLTGAQRNQSLGGAAPVDVTTVPFLKLIQERVCSTAANAYPADPPEPVSRNRAGVQAWLAEAIEQLNWRLSANSNIAALYSLAPTPAPDGLKQVRLRREFFITQQGSNGAWRSDVLTVQVDCDKRQARVINDEHFPQLNMIGVAQVIATPDVGFSAVPADASPLGTAANVACGTGAAPPPPPTVSPLTTALGVGSPPGLLKGDALAAKISAASRNPLGVKDNPVRTNGVAGERAYLERLRCTDDAPPLYTRTGSFGVGVFGGTIDGYRLVCASGGPKEATVYMDMYHVDHVEVAAPAGFKIVAGAPATGATPVQTVAGVGVFSALKIVIGDPKAEELVELFKAFCLDRFPDDESLRTFALSKGAATLTTDQVKTFLKADPGHGWRLTTPLGLYVITIEHPPFHTCAVRRMTPSGAVSLTSYANTLKSYVDAHGATVEPVRTQKMSLAGVAGPIDITAMANVLRIGGKEAEQIAIYLSEYHGHVPSDFAADAAGGDGVEVRLVHQLLKN